MIKWDCHAAKNYLSKFKQKLRKYVLSQNFTKFQRSVMAHLRKLNKKETINRY